MRVILYDDNLHSIRIIMPTSESLVHTDEKYTSLNNGKYCQLTLREFNFVTNARGVNKIA